MQVNLVLSEGRSLGLMIRGGAEYALGIYITGVDKESEAESTGLKVSEGQVEDLSAGGQAPNPAVVSMVQSGHER